MKTIKVSEATNLQLDWLISRLQGYRLVAADDRVSALAFRAHHGLGLKNWCTQPNLMQPIVEKEKIDTVWQAGGRGDVWTAYLGEHDEHAQDGATAHIAAARCFIDFHLGSTVEVPEELT